MVNHRPVNHHVAVQHLHDHAREPVCRYRPIHGYLLHRCHPHLSGNRRRIKAIMKTEILKERRECAILIRHNNTVKTIGEWAQHFNMPKVTLAKWVRDMGPEKAFQRAMAREARPPKKPPVESNPNWSAPLPIFDPELEPKNRLKSWSNRFTPEEIQVKAKMMRLA